MGAAKKHVPIVKKREPPPPLSIPRSLYIQRPVFPHSKSFELSAMERVT